MIYPVLISKLDGFIKFIQQLENYQGFITILGWVAIFFLGLQASKIQKRNSARLEIYKELYPLKLEIDKISVELGLLLGKYSLPFLKMEWAERDNFFTKGKTPIEIWMEQNGKISEASYAFSSAYLRFWNAGSAWNSVMPKMKTARNTLFKELTELSNDLDKYVNYHRSQITEESDWRKWDKKKIEVEAENIRDKFDRVSSGFLNDYMDLIHDELIRPIFSAKRVPREEFNYTDPIESETLTKEGTKIRKYNPTESAKLRKKGDSK